MTVLEFSFPGAKMMAGTLIIRGARSTLPDQPPSVHSLERPCWPVNSFVVSWPLNNQGQVRAALECFVPVNLLAKLPSLGIPDLRACGFPQVE